MPAHRVLTLVFSVGVVTAGSALAVRATHDPQVSDVVVVATNWVRGTAGTDGTDGTFFNIAAQTALAAIVVSALEAVAFGLMPFRFMPGVAIYRWNRALWAVLFGVSLFAFIHILIGPTSGYLSNLTAPAWLAALGVFAAFGAFTILFWAWFRFRPSPTAEGEG